MAGRQRSVDGRGNGRDGGNKRVVKMGWKVNVDHSKKVWVSIKTFFKSWV